jgi:ketosteroid isomerase-like protein
MDETDAIRRMYTTYFEAFQRLDPDAVLPYYHVPCLILAREALHAITRVDEMRSLLGQMMGGLKASAYQRSEWTSLGVRQLDDRLAMLSAGVIRYKSDGAELERFGATYTLRRTDSGWKFVMLAIHDATTVLRLSAV